MSSLPPRLVCLVSLIPGLFLGSAIALDLTSLSNKDATQGIKGALSQGADSAISKLGVAGGFLNNPKVKIPLHPYWRKWRRACG